MVNDVRQLRAARGFSQGQFAHELGVSRQTINSIENDRYTPTLALAISIARFFDKSVEEVFHADATR